MGLSNLALQAFHVVCVRVSLSFVFLVGIKLYKKVSSGASVFVFYTKSWS